MKKNLKPFNVLELFCVFAIIITSVYILIPRVLVYRDNAVKTVLKANIRELSNYVIIQQSTLDKLSVNMDLDSREDVIYDFLVGEDANIEVLKNPVTKGNKITKYYDEIDNIEECSLILKEQENGELQGDGVIYIELDKDSYCIYGMYKGEKIGENIITY
ncbi:MAG: hypothetical protein ACERKV_03995 [Clostridiaceae bacterium]